MNILKVSRVKLAAYLTGAVAAVAVVYRVSAVGKDKIDTVLNKVLNRDTIGVENLETEMVDSDVVTVWSSDDEDADDDEDYEFPED